MKRLQKGFTLIELLVVIAIIGILAGVVLVNVNNARQRARAASIITAISQIRSQQELLSQYVNPVTANATVAPEIVKIRNSINAIPGANLQGNGSSTGWLAWTTLPNSGGGDTHVCADSTGISKVYPSQGTWRAPSSTCP
jgi:prepilin-type N-terminal cleavage/methylation domain-containing protein